MIFATGGQAQLGGTLDAFTRALGAPIDRGNGLIYGFQTHCGSGQADCEQIMIFPGSDEKGYVVSVTLTTSDDHPWDISTAKAICESYMPPDAQFKQEFPMVQGNTEEGIDRFYVSKSISHVFSPSDYTDVNGNITTPGTFDIQYSYTDPSNPNTINSCSSYVGAKN